MAEFQEVCRQALRMAKSTNTKEGLPMKYIGLYITTDGEVPAEHGYIAVSPEKIERDIMEWAAAHLEPKYPSWRDAWKQLFPQACYGMDVNFDCPCPKYFLPYDMVNCNILFEPDRCYTCKNNPIPADIAEKLGIKPLEGGNDRG